MIFINISDCTTSEIVTLLSLEYSLCLELKMMLDESFFTKHVCLSKMIDVTCFVFSHNQIIDEKMNEMLTKRTSCQLQIFDCTNDRMIKSSNNTESHKLFVMS